MRGEGKALFDIEATTEYEVDYVASTIVNRPEDAVWITDKHYSA